VALVKDRAEVASPDDRSGSGIPVARERDTPPQTPLASPGKDLRALARTRQSYTCLAGIVGVDRSNCRGKLGSKRRGAIAPYVKLSLRNWKCRQSPRVLK
jgi:hypothetical protein